MPESYRNRVAEIYRRREAEAEARRTREARRMREAASIAGIGQDAAEAIQRLSDRMTRERQERARAFVGPGYVGRPPQSNRRDPTHDELEIDFSDTTSQLGAQKCHLIRDRLWLTKDGTVCEISKMSDDHLKRIISLFRPQASSSSIRGKMLLNIHQEIEERKRTGKTIEEPKPTKRRIKV